MKEKKRKEKTKRSGQIRHMNESCQVIHFTLEVECKLLSSCPPWRLKKKHNKGNYLKPKPELNNYNFAPPSLPSGSTTAVALPATTGAAPKPPLPLPPGGE